MADQLSGAPSPPQINPAIAVFSSMGSVVMAAATIAPRLVDEGFLDMVDDDQLRRDLLALADAVYQLDYHTTRLRPT
jgi:hypothetical protein